MKCTSRDLAIHRYGPIDFTSKYWRGQAQWLQLFDVLPGAFPNWRVLDTEMPVRHFSINSDLATPLGNALKLVIQKNLGGVLKTFDGCFNIRMVRGSTASFSAHSYGLALDLNAALNPLGAMYGGFYDQPEFVRCFTSQGFSWGGNWQHRRDPMHFSYCWE